MTKRSYFIANDFITKPFRNVKKCKERDAVEIGVIGQDFYKNLSLQYLAGLRDECRTELFCRLTDHGKTARNHFRLSKLRKPVAQMARPVPRLRRMEYACRRAIS